MLEAQCYSLCFVSSRFRIKFLASAGRVKNNSYLKSGRVVSVIVNTTEVYRPMLFLTIRQIISYGRDSSRRDN